MAYFQDADEVYAHIGRLLQELVVDPEMAPALARVDTTVQFRLREPEAQLTVRTPRDDAPAQVDLGESALAPEVVLQMDADVAHRFWLGEVNVAVALAKGDVRARGPVAKILAVVPLVKPGFPRYRAQLEAAGREDLLRAAESRA
jgi:SCP-2 sterol transfer family